MDLRPNAVVRMASGFVVALLLLSGCSAGEFVTDVASGNERYQIPSAAMEPTIPVDSTARIDVGASWQVGDIVTFGAPPASVATGQKLIKRIVAGGGSVIEFIDGDVVVDGAVLDEPYLLEPRSSRARSMVIPGCDGEQGPARCQIPEGYVFMLGDNRNGSLDSRSYGPVAATLIEGVLID